MVIIVGFIYSIHTFTNQRILIYPSFPEFSYKHITNPFIINGMAIFFFGWSLVTAYFVFRFNERIKQAVISVLCFVFLLSAFFIYDLTIENLLRPRFINVILLALDLIFIICLFGTGYLVSTKLSSSKN